MSKSQQNYLDQVAQRLHLTTRRAAFSLGCRAACI